MTRLKGDKQKEYLYRDPMLQIPHKEALSTSEINQTASSNFFVAFKSLPPHKKNALEVVYAIFRLFDDCVDEPSSLHLKQDSLQYWTTEFHKILNNQKAHPVMMQLQAVMADFDIPKEYFLDLIAGCEQDLKQNCYKTLKDTLDYCYKVAGTVGLTCLKIFGHQSSTAEESAVKLGYAFQLTNIIRDVKEDLDRDRIYIPQEFMQKHNYTEDQLKQGVVNTNFQNMMHDLAQVAEVFYQNAYTEQKKDTNNLMKPAWMMSSVYHRLLRKIKTKQFHIFDQKISLSLWQKMWLAIQFTFIK